MHGRDDPLGRRVLGGKALFHPPRPIRVAPELPDRLGVQVQHLELATREATQEQKDLGRADLRGAHRLFRGVAGSGKSIMLALSAFNVDNSVALSCALVFHGVHMGVTSLMGSLALVREGETLGHLAQAAQNLLRAERHPAGPTPSA